MAAVAASASYALRMRCAQAVRAGPHVRWLSAIPPGTPPPLAAVEGRANVSKQITPEEARRAASVAGLDNRIAFVGSGAMASAMLGGLLRNGRTTPDKVMASDTNHYRLDFFREHFGVQTTSDNAEAVKDASIVFLCVKPQTVEKVIPSFKEKMRKDAVLVSIVAGYSVQGLMDLASHDFVVRGMPNTPSLVGAGMTVWVPSTKMDAHQCDYIGHILASFGTEMKVSQEEYLDMVTAISGSGPAYFMLVLEALTDAGVHLGLPRRMARQLVIETMHGSAQLARETGDHPAFLRENITSPGGTTAAALFACEEGGLRTVLQKAVWSAYRRSLEMGGQNSNVGPGRFQQHPPNQSITLTSELIKELAEQLKND